MRRNPDYVLRKINNEPYLLVTGEAAAHFKKEIKLNKTGEIIWGFLEDNPSEEELLNRCYTCFECENDDERKQVKESIAPFIQKLLVAGAVRASALEDYREKARNHEKTGGCAENIEINLPLSGRYCVAGLGLDIYGDKNLVFSGMQDFSTEDTCENVQKIALVKCSEPDSDNFLMHSRFSLAMDAFLTNEKTSFFRGNNGIVMIFIANANVRWMYMSYDGSYVEIHYNEIDKETIETEFYDAIRGGFMYYASLHGVFAIHSASVNFEDKAVLFSAHSGVGKSTHADMWNRLFGTNYINGDVNLLAFENEKPVVYGLPWCGTSEAYSKGKFVPGAIVFLKRAEENSVENLTAEKKTTYLLHRLISPNWDEEQLDRLLNFSEKLADSLDMFRLHCNMENEAAELCRKRVQNPHQ